MARPGYRDLRSPQGAAVGDGGGGANLEHVRQGLLTLHTLLSGTTSRRRREPTTGSPAEAAVAAAVRRDTVSNICVVPSCALGGAVAVMERATEKRWKIVCRQKVVVWAPGFA